MDVESIARVCHEANRGLQVAQADPSVPVAPPWDEASEPMRESARIGVQGVIDGNGPEESHDLWIATKMEQGYRWGPVKDEAKLEHPSLVPYEELPEGQRVKDDLFSAIVKALS